MNTKQVRVVTVRKRRYSLAAIILLTAVGIGSLYLAYQGGLYQSGRIADRTQALSQRVQQLEEINSELQIQLADVEVTAKIDRATADELRQSLAEATDERAVLREEVTFYRSLMAPSSLERGLQISEFALTPLDVERRFRFELLLTQVEARRGVVQGAITVDFVGEKQGSQVVLPLTEIQSISDYPLKYRFRYFQDFDGLVDLPEDFEPLRVVVTVTRQGSREANLQRTFDWLIEEG